LREWLIEDLACQATVYTQVCWTSFLDLNPPNPLKKRLALVGKPDHKSETRQLAQIRILVPLLGALIRRETQAFAHPLFKGDLAAFLFGGNPRIKKRQDRGIHTNFAYFQRCITVSLKACQLINHTLIRSFGWWFRFSRNLGFRRGGSFRRIGILIHGSGGFIDISRSYPALEVFFF
jgi:hypothetical protein